MGSSAASRIPSFFVGGGNFGKVGSTATLIRLIASLFFVGGVSLLWGGGGILEILARRRRRTRNHFPPPHLVPAGGTELSPKSISKLPKIHSEASGHVRSSEALGRVFSLEDASLVLTFEFSETPEALRARFFLRPGHFFARTRCLFDRTGCFFARTGCFFVRTGHFFAQGERTESSPCVPTSPPSSLKSNRKIANNSRERLTLLPF